MSSNTSASSVAIDQDNFPRTTNFLLDWSLLHEIQKTIMGSSTRVSLLLFAPIAAMAAVREPSFQAKSVGAASSIPPNKPDDWFTFGPTTSSSNPAIGNTFGPKDWDKIHCNDIKTCPGFPTNWKNFNPFIPHDATNNMCKHCPRRSNKEECLKHNQSPIDLLKNITKQRLCPDRHRMNYVAGNTRFGKVRFDILPHAVRAYQPKCTVWPNIDYSWGFPHPWLLRYTDVTVPSQHTIDGRRFKAEIILSHTYSKNFTSHLIGNVAILVDVGEESHFYPFFELYLRGWERRARMVAADCVNNRNLQDIHLRGGRESSETPKFSEGNQSLPHRKLGPGTQIIDRPSYKGPYFPHMFYKDCGTEYYFRYEGSTIEPPCLQDVHWRVMRSPVTISRSQFKRLNALFINRLNPETCEKESAGRIRRNTTKRDVNRPLQTTTNDHRPVFCECVSWQSAKLLDVAYCNQTMIDRGVFPHGS